MTDLAVDPRPAIGLEPGQPGHTRTGQNHNPAAERLHLEWTVVCSLRAPHRHPTNREPFGKTTATTSTS